MRRMILSTAMVAAALSSVAFAQGYYGNQGYYRGGDGRYRDGYNSGPRILDRVRADFERGASTSFYARDQRWRFDHAIRELNRFEDKLREGKFDKGKLDSVIDDAAHLSRARDLDPRMRDIMARDADELRAFRANRGGYYGRW